MSRRPVYMRNRSSSSWLLLLLLLIVVGIIYGYRNSLSLQYLVDNSELNGRNFRGVVEEISADKTGIKAYFMKDDTTPLVALSFVFKNAGYAYEQKDGVATLVASMIKEGTRSINADNLRNEMRLKGIKLSFSVDKDDFGGMMVVPSQHLQDAVNLLREILLYPKFERKYLDIAKAQTIKSLEVEKEDPNQELKLEFDRLVYGTHPYGKNPLGSIEVVRGITQGDLREFIKSTLFTDNLYVGIVGNLDKDSAKKVLDTIFAGIDKNAKNKEIEAVDINWQQPVLEIKRDGGQNITAFVFEGTCRTCEDFYPLYIANYLFGGAGLNSKLNQQIREKEGLTYGAYSALVLQDKANLIVSGFSATADKYTKAEEMFKQEWQKIRNKGFDIDELKKAKDYLIASYNLRFASTAGIAGMLVYMQRNNLGLDFLEKRNQYVESVTVEQLNEVAKKYFVEKRLQAVIGSFDKEKK